jgi:N-acetylglucosaminyldiphosphoundecaprenol N-acetyl-beta-D-mannosaminyltransferase
MSPAWENCINEKNTITLEVELGRINALGLAMPALVGAGAAFDFLSENEPQATRWVQHSGLEWLFRLVSEPRRLWKRYLLGYPVFIWRVLLQQLGLLHFDEDRNGTHPTNKSTN